MTAHDLPMAIDGSLVARAVQRATGTPPFALFQRPAKLPRVVFEARVKDRTVYFKAEVQDPSRDHALALEAWAMAQARAAGLPVAEVLHLDCSERDFPFRFLVMSMVEGVALEEAALDREREAEVLREAGALIRRLHAVEVEGFGRLDEDLYLRTGEVRGESPVWAETIEDRALGAVTVLARNRVIDGPQTMAVLARLKSGAQRVPALTRGRLLHGDFDRSHIFVEPRSGSLTGIIDFGDRESGDPEWEMGGFWLWEGERYLAPAVEGYEMAGDAIDGELVRHYGLARLLGVMRRRHEAGRGDAVAALKARFSGLFST